MNETERKQITDANAGHIRDWFEMSDFRSKRLDTLNGHANPSRCDWLFTKADLSVLCEVKTIFSIVQREDFFRDFLEEIDNKLRNDPSINGFPFKLIVEVNRMHIPSSEEKEEYRAQKDLFYKWLKSLIFKTHQTQYPEVQVQVERYTSEYSYFVDQSSIEAYVELHGPYPEPRLEIVFGSGGGIYSKLATKNEIKKADKQLENSVLQVTTSTVVRVVALCPGYNWFDFVRLLTEDTFNAQMGYDLERYDLADWAFSVYPNISAIVLFAPPGANRPAVGFIVTNPNMLDAEKELKAAGIENCMFITGITSDPLSNKD